MRRFTRIRFFQLFIAAIGVAVVFAACHSVSNISHAKERPYDLWMAALKGFQGPVYYMGSEGTYSYFRAGKVFYTHYKAQTSKLGLPRAFPIGKGEPYLVTQEMVYSR